MALIVERQDDYVLCDHPDTRQCHAKVDRYGDAYHDQVAWHVWDTERDDYAAGTGPAQFPRRRDARQWLTDHQERTDP